MKQLPIYTRKIIRWLRRGADPPAGASMVSLPNAPLAYLRWTTTLQIQAGVASIPSLVYPGEQWIGYPLDWWGAGGQALPFHRSVGGGLGGFTPPPLEKGDRGGFTLIEVVAVVAIIAALAIIAVPIAIQRIDQAKATRAGGDTKDIATAMAGLITSVGEHNLAKSSTVKRLILEGPGLTPKNDDGSDDYYREGSSTINWASVKVGSFTPADFGTLIDNLIQNDLDEDGILDEPGEDYDPDKWNGPYLSDPRPDPWGNKYLVLVQGMREGKQDGGTEDVFGWVLSTGPNGRLETDDDSGELGGDDIGIMLTKL